MATGSIATPSAKQPERPDFAMCGRYTVIKKPAEIRRIIDFEGPDDLFQPRFNIAPTQLAPVIVAGRQLKMLRWGLVPAWAKDDTEGAKMINARAETVDQKPAFKRLLERRRCLVLADGFYEWKKVGRGRQPYYFTIKPVTPFAFAGLWDRWHSPTGIHLESFTIITTAANEVVQPVHHRMPAMLAPPDSKKWIEGDASELAAYKALLRPFPAQAMTGYPVDPRVNSPAHDGPDCIEPIAQPKIPTPLELGL
jgi:putative SOS response-associated peptidase YedK